MESKRTYAVRPWGWAWVAVLCAGCILSASAQETVEDFEDWPGVRDWVTATNADGWAVYDARVSDEWRWGTPYEGAQSAWLRDFASSTNSRVRSPLIETGAGAVSFAHGWFAGFSYTGTGTNWMLLEYSTNLVDWVTVTTIMNTSSNWTVTTNAVGVYAPASVRIRKTGELSDAAELYLGLDDIRIFPPPAVTLGNLRHTPASPSAYDSIDLLVDVVGVHPLASNIVLTARYRFDRTGPFASRPMTEISNGIHTTESPLPNGRAGVLEYYVEADYSGIIGPTITLPPKGPDAPAEVIISDPGLAQPDARQLGPCNRRTGLVISEIMYHPADRQDMRDIEFVEVFNAEPFFHDMSGYRLSGEVDYTFPEGTVLEGLSRLVVAASPADVAYLNPVSYVLGPYSNRLANGGGTVRLRNHSGAVLVEASYNDNAPWPVQADGAGHSLVLARPDHGEDSRKAWAPGARMGGSPGMPDIWFDDGLSGIVINEFLAHTDLPDVDFVELHNRGTQPVDVSGCVLTDDPATNRFVLPPGAVVPARGFLAFDQSAIGFSLSMHGDDLFLIDTNAGRVVDGIRFPPQANGVASGRYPDGGSEIRVLASATPGTNNAALYPRDVVINEIMYHPVSEDDDDEYVELYNRGTGTVDLSYWQFTDGISFMFPEDTELAPGSYLVVARDAAHIIARYPQLNVSNTLGDCSGRLSDRGERIMLARPDDIDLPFEDLVTVDTVEYGDGERWGKWADGGGSSLELTDPRADNRRAMNWAGSDETAKAGWTVIEHTGRLDNGRSDAAEALREVQVLLLGAGECLIDDVEVTRNGEANLVPNGDFEGGIGTWTIKGNHKRSELDTGEGYQSTNSLRLIAVDDGDNGANKAETDIASGLTDGQTNVTLRAMGRWRAGHRDVLIRLQGNHLEAVGSLEVPTNMGSPGLPNSRFVSNAGPAMEDVRHIDVLPAAGQDVLVTACVYDPDGIATVVCQYRIDPATSYTPQPMNDLGTGGDVHAQDGIYSARIPGQPSDTVVAFYVEATDGHATQATTQFPEAAPDSECVVVFGQEEPPGVLGSFRIWITDKVRTEWTAETADSNDLFDSTVIYNNCRSVYGAGARYRGSPFIRGTGDPVTRNSAYVVKVPKDDRLLGTRSFNLDGLEFGRDPSYQREWLAFWIAAQLGQPTVRQRYTHVFVNHSRKGVIYTDSHHPSRDFVSEWIPNDTEGDLFEIDDWFEFADNQSFKSANATIQDFTTTGGVKKQARYRWSWDKKTAAAANDDYGPFFRLVDAMNTADARTRDARLLADVDIENWMRVFATRHVVADWDGYSYNRGKNTYTYRPLFGRWKMFPWDLDFALGAKSDSVTVSLFSINDPVLRSNFFEHPRSRRAYWRALQDAANGPMAPEAVEPVADAVYAALSTNGIAVASPDSPHTNTRPNPDETHSIKEWVQTRRQHVTTLLAAVTNAAFAIDTDDFSSGSSPVTIVGSAPVAVYRMRLNGVEYPVYWTGETEWEATVALEPGTNLLQFSGINNRGETVGSDDVTVTYTGTAMSPAGYLVINEVMYHAPTHAGDFVEIHNLSPVDTFSLEGLRINGMDFTFPAGTFIGPTGFVVVAENVPAYQTTYGNAEVLAGEHPGSLDNGGETLQLLMPVGSNSWVVLDEVRYDDNAPWPTNADGLGPSLQLIDASRDNNRIGNWATAPLGPPPAVMSTPGKPNNVAAALPPFPLLWINEIMPSNMTCEADNQGEFEPWVELYNADTGAVDLGEGYYLSDDATNLTKWAFPPGQTVSGNGHLLVWTDGEPGETVAGFLHAGFRINSVSGCVVLVREYLGTNIVLDALWYDSIGPDYSYGSYPEGDPYARQVFHSPTPGSANSPTSQVVLVRINEWMADNDNTLRDPVDQDFEDWFELYNAGGAQVNLGGYTLDDELGATNRFTIPGGTVLPGGAYLLVWADEETGQNAPGGHLHVDFKLSRNGDTIALFAPDGSLVDAVSFGAQLTDRGEGRWPDGNPSVYVMAPPTPGTTNQVLIITALSGEGPPEMTVTWDSESGAVYRVDRRDALNSGSWAPLGLVTAQTTSATITDTNAVPGGKRFYRLAREE